MILKNYIGLVFGLLLILDLPARAGDATNAAPAAAGTNQVKQVKAASFKVNRYDIRGNTLLSQPTIDGIFTNATGSDITVERIRKALGELQLAYRERGYVTVGISLPQQQLTNAVVVVDVTEAKLADIRIKGNRFFSSNNVRRDLPSLRTNTLLNSKVFQRELDQANANRDRQIYPTIEPGPLPGTSALILKVQDRFPFHARADIDNYATPGTPELRINLSAQYDNLWQLNHQLGVSYGFSPSASKADGLMSDYLFNEPQISYYGAYYRIPFGADSVADQVSGSQRFGYSEATHQFILPPGGDTPDFTLYASASASDTGVLYGPNNVVASQTNITITRQESDRNLSINEDLGGRFSFPINISDQIHWKLSAGADYKRYALTTFTTNSSFFIATAGNDSQNNPIPPTLSINPPYKRAVNYIPVNVGVDFMENDQWGDTSASVNAAYNLFGGSDNFAAVGSPYPALQHFGKINLTLTRAQTLYHDWSLLGRAGAQGATGSLISNEQFSIGGINSVRGYYEGDDYGDAGWFTSLELRSPYLQQRVAGITGAVPAWARGSIFVDYGSRYLLHPVQGISQNRSELGAGFSLLANINNHLDAKVTVGWPVLQSANTEAVHPRVYVSVGGQF